MIKMVMMLYVSLIIYNTQDKTMEIPGLEGHVFGLFKNG